MKRIEIWTYACYITKIFNLQMQRTCEIEFIAKMFDKDKGELVSTGELSAYINDKFSIYSLSYIGLYYLSKTCN
jgi:hypothetical protein